MMHIANRKSQIANCKASKRRTRAFKKDFTISDKRLAISEMGFTLIELLIVIAVIGILAAAILPRFVSFSDEAAVGATKGGLSSLRAALAIYAAKNDGVYPAVDSTPGYETTVKTALVTAYIDFIPGEQVTGSLTKQDEENKIYSAFGSEGGWVYDGTRFFVNEDGASAW